jgi:O-antigen ligase
MSVTSPGASTLTSRALAPAATAAAGLLLVIAAVVLAPISTAALVAIGVVLLGLVAYAAVRWPRAAIVVVVLAPILDRYVVGGLLPSAVEGVAHYLSEGLLVVVGLTLAVRAWRAGRLGQAIRHPVLWATLAFVGVAAVSAIVNGVPPLVALVGIGFTVDAVAVFFLPRLVGFDLRQSLIAVAAFVAVVTAAALVVLLQALLSPDIFGLSFVTGRFGEIYRLAAFIGDPNVFGTFAAAASPFVLLAATSLSRPRWRWLAIGLAFLLLLTLWLSFSRGAWLAMAIGAVLVLLMVDRRTFLLAIGMLALAFVVAQVMPRDLALPSGGTGQPRPDLVDSTIGRVDTVGSGRDLRTLFVINAVPILRDHPAVGVGPGRYGGAAADMFGTPIYERYGTDELFTVATQRTVDNFWLHLVVETGLLGLAAFLAAALSAGIPVLRAARRARGWWRVLLGGAAAGSAALAVSAVSTMLLEANSVAFVFWFLLGLAGLSVPAVGSRAGAAEAPAAR